MKKLLSMILVVSMLAICASCGTNKSSEKLETVQTEEKGEKEESAEQTKEAAGVSLEGKRVMLALNALGDLSFNDLLYKGLLAIQDTYGLEVEYAEVGTDISTYEGYFFDFVDAGYDYVFLRSGFMELCETYAADYPDMRFIVYDTTPLDTCSADNVYLYSIATYQAAFLVGMAAAGTSETGVIGFVGGQENPLINDFLCGYIQGALYADENIKVCSAFMGDYNDAGKAMELATAQIGNHNADIIFAACGGASLGVFQTCKDKGVLAIGCDSDQYSIYTANGETDLASVIMTSCLKAINASLEAIMKDVADGVDIFADEQAAALDLSDKVTGVADNENYQKYVSQELRRQIAEAEQDIISQKITVKSAYYMSQSEIDELVNSVTP
ncbi:BMP family ABC transporter substrate-binding protein [Candidatus Merdisoma sp. JLR.KK011]|uniref:BMP family lipoprotein n=1 Tax=Candidatus Merdisoma sp. JLR.KK011 TaxID=3114299 RepID=UPI002FF1D8E5